MNAQNDYAAPIKLTIQNEHRELAQALRGIHQLLSEKFQPAIWEPRVQELAERLGSLQTLLEDHFRREESEGYLDEAVASLPRLATHAREIVQQHPALLSELEKLLQTLRSATSSRESWERILLNFEAFAKHVVEHESAEHQLLQQGFNEDFEL